MTPDNDEELRLQPRHPSQAVQDQYALFEASQSEQQRARAFISVRNDPSLGSIAQLVLDSLDPESLSFDQYAVNSQTALQIAAFTNDQELLTTITLSLLNALDQYEMPALKEMLEKFSSPDAAIFQSGLDIMQDHFLEDKPEENMGHVALALLIGIQNKNIPAEMRANAQTDIAEICDEQFSAAAETGALFCLRDKSLRDAISLSSLLIEDSAPDAIVEELDALSETENSTHFIKVAMYVFIRSPTLIAKQRLVTILEDSELDEFEACAIADNILENTHIPGMESLSKRIHDLSILGEQPLPVRITLQSALFIIAPNHPLRELMDEYALDPQDDDKYSQRQANAHITIEERMDKDSSEARSKMLVEQAIDAMFDDRRSEYSHEFKVGLTKEWLHPEQLDPQSEVEIGKIPLTNTTMLSSSTPQIKKVNYGPSTLYLVNEGSYARVKTSEQTLLGTTGLLSCTAVITVTPTELYVAHVVMNDKKSLEFAKNKIEELGTDRKTYVICHEHNLESVRSLFSDLSNTAIDAYNSKPGDDPDSYAYATFITSYGVYIGRVRQDDSLAFTPSSAKRFDWENLKVM